MILCSADAGDMHAGTTTSDALQKRHTRATLAPSNWSIVPGLDAEQQRLNDRRGTSECSDLAAQEHHMNAGVGGKLDHQFAASLSGVVTAVHLCSPRNPSGGRWRSGSGRLEPTTSQSMMPCECTGEPADVPVAAIAPETTELSPLVGVIIPSITKDTGEASAALGF